MPRHCVIVGQYADSGRWADELFCRHRRVPAVLQRSEEDACGGMSSFVERMQSGNSGPSERLTLDLAALGGLITALQQVVDRIGALEVKKEVNYTHTRYRELGPELIPVYRQSARR